jgi:hypothetical protein
LPGVRGKPWEATEDHGKPDPSLAGLQWGSPARLVRLTLADHGHQVPMKNRQMEPIFKVMSVRNKYCNPCVCFPTSETVLHYSTVYSHSFVKGMNILDRYYVHTSNCISVHIHVWMYLYGYMQLWEYTQEKNTQIHKYVYIYMCKNRYISIYIYTYSV